MKLGFSEIFVILVVIGVMLLVLRGMSATRTTTQPPARVRFQTAEELEEARIRNSRRSRFRILGGAFIILGLIVLASTFKMFDLLLTWSTGAALIILAGILVLFLSARR